jgi:hypothetical protein
MKSSTAAYVRKYQALLNAAKNQGSAAQIRWRSMDLGSWNDLHPRWNLAGGKILFHFFHEKSRSFRISSIKPNPSGITILLSCPRNPIPEPFDVRWLNPAFEGCQNSGQLWELLRQWLKLNFPACKIMWAGKRSDLARSISGRFLRAIFQTRGHHSLLIAVDPDAGSEAHLALSQALLWLACPAVENRIKAPASIHFLIPSGSSSILNHRCQYLNRKRVDAKVWEYEEGKSFQVSRAETSCAGVEDKDFRWPVTGPFRWSAQLEQVLKMAPDLIRRYPRFYDYDSLRLWGLEFAQATGSDRNRICFGVGMPRIELNEDNYDCLRNLVNEIMFFRRPDSPDTQHPYYKLQAERWLESLILENIPELFPEMAPESVYSQIPVYVGKDPGRVDILGADLRGTLTVMELKVSEDADMPVQALDYWGRVIRHNANGDFKRRGYFSEINLNRQRPKIYLVSPVFSFHSSTESLLRYLEPELEVWKIAINEDWRCGVKILRRVRYCCGELE